MAPETSHEPKGRVLRAVLFWAIAGLVLMPVGLGLMVMGLVMLGVLLLGMLAASVARRALQAVAGHGALCTGHGVAGLLSAVESGRLSAGAAVRRLLRPARVRRPWIMLMTLRVPCGEKSFALSLPFTPIAIMAVGLEVFLYPIVYVVLGGVSLGSRHAALRALLSLVPALPVSRVLSSMLLRRSRFEIAVGGAARWFRFAIE